MTDSAKAARSRAEEACGICELNFDTPEGAGEIAKCGHLHLRCIDKRVEWGASSRCPECRLQTVVLTDEQELWEAAVIAWIRGRYEECFEPVSKLLEKEPSHLRGNRMLGDLYYQGTGTEKDFDKAKAVYEVASAGGDAHSGFRVGLILKAKLRFEEAFQALEVAKTLPGIGSCPSIPGAPEDDVADTVEYMRQFLACMEALKTDRRAMRCFDNRLRSDLYFARRAVEISGFALDFLCEELQSDEDLVVEAVRQNSYAFQFASPTLRGSSAFLIRLMNITAWHENGVRGDVLEPRGVCLGGGWVMEFATEDVQNDREAMLVAVKSSGGALKFASEQLRGDKEVVLEAVRQDGLALEFASANLREDQEVASAAIANNASAMRFVEEKLRGDSKFVLSLMRRSSFALRYASRELREDRDFILQAIKQDGLALRWAYEELRTDPALLLEAEKRCGWAVCEAPKELLADRNFMLQAISKSNQALNFATEEFRNDHASVLEAVRTKGSALQFAPKVCHGDREVVIEAARQNCSSLAFADEDLREDPAFINEAFNPPKARLRRGSSSGSKGSTRSRSKGSKQSIASKALESRRGSRQSPSHQGSKQIPSTVE